MIIFCTLNIESVTLQDNMIRFYIALSVLKRDENSLSCISVSSAE